MTIIVAVKISDGIVVASDSASSLMDGSKNVINIYNNANKIYNLRKGCPIGAMAAGAGSIGALSISTIAKDFRQSIGNAADINKWTVEKYSKELFNYIKNNHYDKFFKLGAPNNPDLNIWVFGFSPNASLPELWKFSLGVTHSQPAEELPKDEAGISSGGEPDLVQRIVAGYGTLLPDALKKLGVSTNLIDQALAAQRQQVSIVVDAMPIQDAIELADFLVRSTIEFSRFKMGAPTVGGPIEIAAVTKHEGFKWVKRKHYFNAALNPE